MDTDSTDAYLAASDFFVRLVAATPRNRHGEPGLGSWSVLELIAHANRAHTTVVDYVEHPVDPRDVSADYFTEAAIRRRARRSLELLGHDPAGGVAVAAARAQRLIAASEHSTPVGSPIGAMTLAEYLPSRTAELVIHTLDLSRAVGDGSPPPAPAVHECLAYFLDLAQLRGHGTELLLALTGRVRLSEDFSLV